MLRTLARISRTGHGLRDAVAPTGQERRAARCCASGKRLDAPCRRDSAALRVVPRRPTAASKALADAPASPSRLFLADRPPGRDAGHGRFEKCGLDLRRRIAASAIIAAGAIGAVQPAAAQEAVSIGTSSVGSVFYTLAVGASEIISKYSDVNATVEPVGGSTASMFRLGEGRIDFAIANAFASFSAFNGKFTFDEAQDVRLVMQGQPSNRGLVVRSGSGIDEPKDLIGKTVIGERRALPALALVMDAFIKHYDLPRDKINIVATTNSGEAYKALRVGTVDAAWLPFSARSPAIAKPLRDGVIAFYHIPKEDRDAMLKSLPAVFYGGTLAPGTWPQQKKPWHLFTLNTYFMTRADLAADTVYKVTKAMLDHNKEFSTYHRAAKQWTAKHALQNVALPMHAGAIRYFKEIGTWTDQLAAKQKELAQR